MIENVTLIKSEITVSVGASVKIQENISVRKVIFGILQHVASKR